MKQWMWILAAVLLVILAMMWRKRQSYSVPPKEPESTSNVATEPTKSEAPPEDPKVK